MAQIVGRFDNEQAAQAAAQKLRAMDIPDSDIVLSREGKGSDAHVLLTAEVPDFQSSAARAVINAGGASPRTEPTGGNPVPAPAARADAAREDYTDEAGGGTLGAISGGLVGGAVAGPVGAVGGAALGAAGGAAAADIADDDNQARIEPSGRGRAGTAGDVLGTRTDEGATADADIAAMGGPGVIGSGAMGGPAAFTARAAAIGSERDVIGDDLDNDNPDTDGDTINSVSPR